MPTYQFICPKCKHKFEELSLTMIEPKELCPLCGEMAPKDCSKIFAPRFVVKDSWEKKVKEDDPLEGIPLGEVPGDEDYIGMDDPDYIGPKP